MTREFDSARERPCMRRRVVSALLILALGLLPGVPAGACPSGQSETADSHVHADHPLESSGHHDSAGATLHDHASESASTVGSHSPSEKPSGHSEPTCCRGSSPAAVTAAWEGVPVRTPGAVPVPAVVAVPGTEPQPALSSPDPRRLRPDERRSPYVRTRAPLLI